MRALVIAEHMDLPEAHLFAGLARAGVEILALARPERRHASILEAGGARFESWEWSRRLWSPNRRRLRELLGTWRPRIVHSLHNDALRDVGRAWPDGDAVWIAYRGAPFISRRAHHMYRRRGIARIVCLSQTVRAAMLRAGWPEERLVVIYKGHDPAWYRPATPARLAALGLPDGARCVGAAARWRAGKGGVTLVEAFLQLPFDPRVHLLMIGEVVEPRLVRMRRRLADHPQVHFVGHQPDAPALLGACAMTVMPSGAAEGLCKAVLESLAQGAPAVVSNVGGPAEIVRDGVEGLCVPPGDAVALAGALRRLLEDEPLRRACGERALARIRETFHISTTIERYRALYAELAGRE